MKLAAFAKAGYLYVVNELTTRERKRYSRHLVLENFGEVQQLALRNARVLVIGAGGLGSPILLYLSAAGIGTIGIVDSDDLEESNLQRQVLFTMADIGKNKAISAANRLGELNPFVRYNVYPQRISSANALSIVREYDIVVDGSDNFETRYLMNDACVMLDKPYVYGSILQFEGQVAVFNLKKADGTWSSNYRDLFPEPPPPGTVQNCEQAGVLGVLPGVIGSMMANETIKIAAGIGLPLADKLLLFDSLSMDQRTIRLRNTNSRKDITSLIDYDQFCGHKNTKHPNTMKEIDVHDLEKMKQNNEDFQLIDVREAYERDIAEIGGELIPVKEIPNNVDKISRDKKVVIYCRSGARSGNVVKWLEENHKFDNVYNLKGGILAWSREIDPEVEQY